MTCWRRNLRDPSVSKDPVFVRVPLLSIRRNVLHARISVYVQMRVVATCCWEISRLASPVFAKHSSASTTYYIYTRTNLRAQTAAAHAKSQSGQVCACLIARSFELSACSCTKRKAPQEVAGDITYIPMACLGRLYCYACSAFQFLAVDGFAMHVRNVHCTTRVYFTFPTLLHGRLNSFGVESPLCLF